MVNEVGFGIAGLTNDMTTHRHKMNSQTASHFVAVLLPVLLMTALISGPTQAASNIFDAAVDKANTDRIGARARVRRNLVNYLRANARHANGQVVVMGKYGSYRVKDGAIQEFPQNMGGMIVCWNKDPSQGSINDPACTQLNGDGYFKFEIAHPAGAGCIGTIWAAGGLPAIEVDVVIKDAAC